MAGPDLVCLGGLRRGVALRLHAADGGRPALMAAYHPDPVLTDALLGAMERTTRGRHLGLWRPVIAEQRALRLKVDPDAPHPGCSATTLAFARRWSVRGLLGAPLVARGRVLGGIALVRCGDERPFSATEEVLLVQLADRAALALDLSLIHI